MTPGWNAGGGGGGGAGRGGIHAAEIGQRKMTLPVNEGQGDHGCPFDF